MASLKEIVIMYQSLKREWDKKPPNLDRCGDFLTKLKIALTGVTFLPTDESAPSKQELLVARDILEIGAQWAIAKRDIPVFERYMAQLKCYYMDYKDNLPESTYKYQLLGLNLLCLLAQNRLAEFHTELELLPVKELQNNIYIKHPVSMEQYLMEGSYNKVFLAKGNVPAENYNFFIDILLDTIRNEIASCIEKAYEKIALNEAARMLFFENAKPMKDYAVQRGWTLPPDGFFHFQHEKKDADEVIPAKMLAEQTIEYARELEMIV
ncbi:26S proteasome non-ATPase regulatory subunit 8-like [Crassostrea angulata]|uniref:26S proteasome non-ATPase regulatory subunit 8 n=3 Tax=Magallana gigas TaxID=29159 RepID=K1QVR0_MAGGI|nr:26S proteasome non-ATPase regulatory subunit 8 [Crassostrea gigas]XP_052700636.1 26S proteasome non-ATPase regulatory subunit 8-like [Crassostrea angulata]|eukprot:XP_011453106.1 PREDICTED: 26S proteasome non-ATPase regulatory subunit 8 isoform X1 [Crassostrea gigas]